MHPSPRPPTHLTFHRTPSVRPALCTAAIAGTLLGLGACSSAPTTGRRAAATTPSRTTEGATPAGGGARPEPARPLSSRTERPIDPYALEKQFVPAVPREFDPVLAQRDGVPFTSMPAGAFRDTANLDGMESLTQVTYASQGSDFDPCISRDGNWVVFASTQHRPTSDIYLKAATGRTVTQLTADPAQDVMPQFSPDARRIAFSSSRSGNWDIYIMSTGGGQPVQVSGDNADELHPSWSPDGRRIVYCRLGEISGRWEMWVADVESPNVSEFIGYGLFPSWCTMAGTGEAGRDKILYQRSRERGDRAFSVWTLDYKPGDASNPTEILSSRSAAIINPAWSPDGTRIVFASVAYPGVDPANAGVVPRVTDLWMASIDGTSRVNLTAGRSLNLMPTWGPDNRIYFVSNRGGLDNIWSIGTEKALAAIGANPAHNNANATKPDHEMANVPEQKPEK